MCLAALAVAACGSEPSAPPADAPPGALVVGADGVAGLGAATAFDTVAVRAALPPGFAVERQPGGGPDGAALWALRDGRLVFEVYAEGDRVGRVEAVSDDVLGPDGARVGYSRFADLDGADLDCERGTGALDGRAVCEAGPVRYAFASGAIAPGQDLPDADQLADALLERIVWTAE